MNIDSEELIRIIESSTKSVLVRNPQSRFEYKQDIIDPEIFIEELRNIQNNKFEN
jgi:hypothetical protein